MPFERLTARARTALQSFAKRMGASSALRWKTGLWEEVAFWDEWFATRGGQWPGAFERRCDPERPLDSYLIELLDHPAGATVKILDVGAGPLTKVGKVWPGRTVELTPIDPLARQYDRLLRKYDVEPLVRTRPGAAEKLRDIFPRDTFDLVHASNCIDHSYDPRRAFHQMLEVVKPGCCVYLNHSVDEADRQGHGGLHQWNFRERNKDFIVAGASYTANITQELRGLAAVQCNVLDDTIVVIMRKQHID